MRRLPVLLLIGTLGLGALAACGDDESRRTGAIDPTEKSTVRTLSLTVVHEQGAWGYARPLAGVSYGRRTATPPLIDCTSAVEPGRTCTWGYLQSACPAEIPDCTVTVHLAAWPRPGERVVWTGCPSSSSTGCSVELPSDTSVKATFVKTPPRKLSLTVINQAGASGSVEQTIVSDGARAGGTPGTLCASAAAPGTTCTWEYLQSVCPGDKSSCPVSVSLYLANAAASAVVWSGCSSSYGSSCTVALPEDKSVQAVLIGSKSSVRKLSLTVVGPANFTDPLFAGSVIDQTVWFGSRAEPTPVLQCKSSAAPGSTCTWEYLQGNPPSYCSSQIPDCTVSARLVAFPSAGLRVVWSGCSLVIASGQPGGATNGACIATLPGDKGVKATFEVDPKGGTG